MARRFGSWLLRRWRSGRSRCVGAGPDRQARKVGADRGQVRGEVVASARGAGDGATAVGAGKPIEVGHERRPQCDGGIAHALLETLSQQAGRVDWLGGEHAEVKQHLPGSVCARWRAALAASTSSKSLSVNASSRRPVRMSSRPITWDAVLLRVRSVNSAAAVRNLARSSANGPGGT